MQQPIYWPEKSKDDTNRYQTAKESYDLKTSGDSWNIYDDGNSHPLNDLEDIFGKDDRENAYQHRPKESLETILDYEDAGVQVNYSGCLIENVNSLADAGYFEYYSGWEDNFAEAKSWTTSGGFTRMDMIGFTFHHALSPLISERALAKEIQAHKYISVATFGGSYSKGYWPAECSFSERIIKVLVEEGLEWSIVANSHLSRTLNDYSDNNYGTSGVNIDPPNAADKVSTDGNNWWSGQIDGRGGSFAAPYCYQAHKAKYVDPETETEYTIDVVPMADLLSYQDGYQTMSTGDIESYIAPYDDEKQPSIVLLAHDGDNAFAGGYSYYMESVSSFTSSAASLGYSPTTVQQFLSDHPVPSDDIVKVEDGAWVNAESDWGHPQFINWLWPLYESTNYRFDPDGWTEDARNWAVITAAENYVIMAEDLAGSVDIEDIVYSSSGASNAEKAWHFFLPSLTSGYMYYGKALDMEVKQTIAGNNAIEFAQLEIENNSGVDNTAPSVFIPQRFPYNPGGKGFGPVYSYTEFDNSSDFDVWTFAYDVNGLQSVELKYRTDNDGVNPLTDNVNDVYADGSGVSSWTSITMTTKEFPKTNTTGDSDIDFFVLPTAIADLCYAEISGLSDVLVDYYVEATDTYGNVFKTPIQHVYVGEYNSLDEVTIEVTPESGNYTDTITVSLSATTTADGATTSIYYTTDGATPDSTSTIYTDSFELFENTTIKAIAYDSEDNASDVESRTYTFGTIEDFTVHFKNTSDWDNVYIYVFNGDSQEAIDGWEWPGELMTQEAEDSPWFAYTIKEGVTAGIVFNDGDQEQTDDLTRTYDGWYVFSEDTWYDECPGDCPTSVPELTVDPEGGDYDNSVTVTLSATNDGIITYTLDGTDPLYGIEYSEALTFTDTTNLRAIAVNDSGSSEEIDEWYYIVDSQCDTIYYYNENDWSSVYIYTWDLSTEETQAGSWPGLEMTQVGTSDWYYWENCYGDELGIVFNNGDQGEQTDDLSATSGWYYYSTWYTSCPGNCPGDDDEEITIYYDNSSTDWSTPSVYFWSTTPNTLTTTWPGELMNDDGDDWYSYTLSGVECANLIFSDYGSSQTDDLYICGTSYYSDGWVSEKSTGKNVLSYDEINTTLYPNPFSNEFVVSFKQEEENVNISIVNLNGITIYSESLDKAEGEISIKPDIPEGTYFLFLSTNSGVHKHVLIKE